MTKKQVIEDRYAVLDIPTKQGSISLRIHECAIDSVVQGVQTMVEDESSARARGAFVPMKAPGRIRYITIAYLGEFAESKYDYKLGEKKTKKK